jgi:hypothetical protein
LRSGAISCILWKYSEIGYMMISREFQHSINQRISMGVEYLTRIFFNSEGPSSPSDDDCYCTATERIPSWREFAEGIPTFPPSCGYYRSTIFEGSSHKRHRSIPLQYPNRVLFRSQLYALSSHSTLPHMFQLSFIRSCYQFLQEI